MPFTFRRHVIDIAVVQAPGGGPYCVKSKCYRGRVLPQIVLLPSLAPAWRPIGLGRAAFPFL
jgi:hypothetical protein